MFTQLGLFSNYYDYSLAKVSTHVANLTNAGVPAYKSQQMAGNFAQYIAHQSVPSLRETHPTHLPGIALSSAFLQQKNPFAHEDANDVDAAHELAELKKGELNTKGADTLLSSAMRMVHTVANIAKHG